jgi:hypothetical protein
VFLRGITISGQNPKTVTIRAGEFNGYTGAHVPDSHKTTQMGIPKGTLLLSGIH